MNERTDFDLRDRSNQEFYGQNVDNELDIRYMLIWQVLVHT